MATRDPRSSTTEEFLPFLPGQYDVEDSGELVNVIAYKHSYGGRADQVYYTPRPGVFSQNEAVFKGEFISANEDRIATTESLYSTLPLPLLTGAVQTTWKTVFDGFNTRAPVIRHIYTAENEEFHLILDPYGHAPDGHSYLFVSPTSGAASVAALPFKANPYAVSLDGYLFVAEGGGDTIFNSDLNDVDSWDLTVNLIRATQYPGRINALGRISSYVVALKEHSIEFFYNAGLSDTSPLERNASYTKQIGLRVASSLVSADNHLYFIGSDQGGGKKVYDLTETSCTPISVPSVEEDISSVGNLSVDTRAVNAFFMGFRGKRFYVLQLGSTTPLSQTSNITYVYDIDEKKWAVWRAVGGESLVPQYKFNFPLRYMFSDRTGNLSALGVVGRVEGSTEDRPSLGYISIGLPSGQPALVDSELNPVTLETTHKPFTVSLSIPPTDFGTFSRKFIRQLSVAGYVKSGSRFQHQITVTKFNEVQTQVSQTATDWTNLRMWNLGQCKLMGVKYTLTRDPYVPVTTTVSAEDIRILGVHCLISKGN